MLSARLERPPKHTDTHSRAHSLLFVAASWREALPQSDGVFGPNRSSSLVWGAGRAAVAAEIYDSGTLGCRGMCLSLDPRECLCLFLTPSLVCVAAPLLCLSVAPSVFPHSWSFSRSPSPFVSLSPRVSHSSLHSRIYSCRALAATTVGQSYISVMGFTNKE